MERSSACCWVTPASPWGPCSPAGAPARRVTDLHPGLTPLADRTFLATDLDTIGSADVVFLALPHGESGADRRGAARRDPRGRPRRRPPARAGRGVDPLLRRAHWSGHWTYGMPELPGHREPRSPTSRRIANPGCYPTGVILGLAPLLAAGLVEPADVVVVAASGTTGAGRKPSDALLASTVMGQLSAYKAGGTHQHTPEMEQALTEAAGEPVTVSFTPVLAPMPRGILATTTARLAPGVTTEVLHEALRAAYADEPFVSVLPPRARGRRPARRSARTPCTCRSPPTSHSGRAVVVSAIDNLVKGAAGQAVQNANIALGLDETAGLTAIGVAP